MPRIKWPPKVARIDHLGEVKDASGRKVPRDVGMPAQIGGQTYYIFGDTFCHDHKGGFVGGTNNTIAWVPDYQHNPTMSQYLQQDPKIVEFVPHTQSEKDFEAIPAHKKAVKRVTNWVFGGIITDYDGASTGWTFFHKVRDDQAIGVSVARVEVVAGNQVKANRVTGDHMVFPNPEPNFGAISYLIEDGWVYLLGSRDVKPPFDMRMHWARIRRDADFTRRENYQFHLVSGEWGPWTSGKQDDLARIGWLETQSQGDVLYAPEMAPEGRPYLWFGVNKFSANHLYVACNSTLTGTWDVQDAGEIPALYKPGSQRYALFPHPRVSKTDQGQMLLSWSDAANFGGAVVQAYYNFELEGGAANVAPPVPGAQTRPGPGGGGGYPGQQAPQAQQAQHHGSLRDEVKGVVKNLFK